MIRSYCAWVCRGILRAVFCASRSTVIPGRSRGHAPIAMQGSSFAVLVPWALGWVFSSFVVASDTCVGNDCDVAAEASEVSTCCDTQASGMQAEATPGSEEPMSDKEAELPELSFEAFDAAAAEAEQPNYFPDMTSNKDGVRVLPSRSTLRGAEPERDGDLDE